MIPNSAEALPEAWIERLLACHRSLLVARLTAPAAHEIINPISAAVNLASLVQHILKEDDVPLSRLPEIRSHLKQVVSESARAGRYASELLAFARSSPRPPSRIDINELVRQTRSLAAHMLKMADVASELVLQEDLPWVHGESAQLQQALLDLIVNAVDATAGRANRQIRIATGLRQDGRIRLLVHDNGEGIAQEHLAEICDPFFTTRNRPDHLGLGLTVARTILERHKGEMEVESRIGEGATFQMILPAGIPEDER
jgi:two-component system, NtrC family, sensor kinase